MSHSAVCWQCGASLAELSLPLSRFDVCKQCHAELHACRMCLFYEITVARQCREPIAEEVRDKQRANICDYFSPRDDAYQPAATTATQQARAQLDALFGTTATSARPEAGAQTDVDPARAALNDLFGGKQS
ncbi:MAG: hypothetical protein AB7T07_11510 [Steroidobacteraceae bacterium]